MKQTLTALLLLICVTTNAQIASRLLPSQAHVQGINAKNIVWVDTVAGGQQRIWVADRDSLKLYTFQIRGLKDSVQNWGDERYPQLTATYFNPTFIGSIAANKLTGLNAAMIESALGYMPYDSNNPNNYITSSSLSTKQNYADTSTWDVTMTTLEQQRYLKNLDTFNLSNFANDVGYITGITYNDVVGALGVVPIVQEVDGDTLNEIQTLTKSGTNITLSRGGTISINDNDSSNTNELQTIGIVNRIITLSNAGGTVTIPYQSYDSLTNKPVFGTAAFQNSTAFATAAQGLLASTALQSEVDGSTTNELQTLSGSNRTVSLSNGGGNYSIPFPPYDSLTGKPTIPTNTNQLTNGANFITRTGISLTTTGSGAATYNSGTGVINIPTPTTAKRQETYAGTTDASGNYTITFPSAYSVVPNVQASITNQSNSQQFIMVTSATTTGCTIKVVQRNASFLSLLGLDVLTTGVTNVNGASVAVLVTER